MDSIFQQTSSETHDRIIHSTSILRFIDIVLLSLIKTGDGILGKFLESILSTGSRILTFTAELLLHWESHKRGSFSNPSLWRLHIDLETKVFFILQTHQVYIFRIFGI